MLKKQKKWRTILVAMVFILVCTTKVQSQQTCPSWGPYLEGFEMNNYGELYYTEVMVDNSCDKVNTYFSTLNFSLGPRGGYAGIQHKPNNVYNNIFSMWDLQDSDVPQCTAEYSAPNTLVTGFGGEGTGLHTSNPMQWKLGVWYATVIRRWSIGDGKTRIGFFMYDYGTNIWKHYVTIVTPEDNATFTTSKVGAFVENFWSVANKDTRCGYFRNFWSMNNQGLWSKPKTYKASAGTGSWNAERAFNNTAIKVSACGNTPSPVGNSVTFSNINQSGTRPSTITPISVSTVTPSYNSNNNSVNVTWAYSTNTSPQLSYTVSLYTQSSWSNNYTPVKTVTGIRPDQRSVSIPLPENSQSGKYYVSVVLKDIFNQKSNFGYNSLSINNINTPPSDVSTYYRIKNVKSGKYISPINFSRTNGISLAQYPISSNYAQQWKLEEKGNYYIIINRASNLAIDIPSSNTSNGTTLIQYSKHGGYNQQWILNPYNNLANTYIITSRLNGNKAMDNFGGFTASGTAVIIWDKHSGQNQQWILEKVQNSSHRGDDYNQSINDEIYAKIYPNPVKKGENFHINLPNENTAYTLSITNAEGLNVVLKSITGGKNTISTTDLPKGVYFYNAKSKENNISGKLIVK